MKVFGGKWKPYIVWYLNTNGTKRYGEIKRVLPDISHKMLSQQLKELEKDGVVMRIEYHQIPPKVEYSLTQKGATFIPILLAISEWGLENLNLDQKADSDYSC
jgi:DNA-binding HxlR family transcriptional regulator